MKIKRIVTSFLSILLVITNMSFPIIGTSASTVSNQWKSKMNNALCERIETLNDDDLVSVWVWFEEADIQEVEEEAKKLSGISFENLNTYSGQTNLINELNSSLDSFHLATQNTEVSDIWMEYLKTTEEQRKQESKSNNSFRRIKRKLLSEEYLRHNSRIMDKIGINKESIVFESSFTPSAILKLTKSQIQDIASMDVVSDIYLDEFDEAPEPDINTEKESMRVDYVADYFHLTGDGIKALLIDTDYIRPDLFPSYEFTNLSKVYNIYNQQFYSITDVSNLSTLYREHGTMVASVLQNYAPNIEMFGTTCYAYNDIEWALNNLDIDIINGSVNYSCPSDYLDEVHARWYDALVANTNTVLIASAGNSQQWLATNWPNVISPACCYNSIAVGAYKANGGAENNERQPFRYNPINSSTLVCYKPDVLISSGSTSAAAPALTGIISYLFEIRPSLINEPEAVKAIIMASSHRKVKPSASLDGEIPEYISEGLTQRQGAGAVDAYRALRIVLNQTYGVGEVTNGTVTLDTEIKPRYDDNVNISIAWHRQNTGSPYSVTLGTLQELELDVYDSDDNLVKYSHTTNSGKQMVYLPEVPKNTIYNARVTKTTVNSEAVQFGYAWSERGVKKLSYISSDGITAIGKTLSVTARKEDWNIANLKEVRYEWSRSTDNCNWSRITVPDETNPNNVIYHNSNTYTLSDEDIFNYIKCEVVPLDSSLLSTNTLIATFNPRVVKYGDINLDGYIDSLDTDYLYQYLGEYISLLTDEQFLAADVTGDGQVNVEDLSDLQRYLNGYITQFPVEE